MSLSEAAASFQREDTRRELDVFREQWISELRQDDVASRAIPRIRNIDVSRSTTGDTSTSHGPATAPISKLDEDVLSAIFYAVASLEPASGTPVFYDDKFTLAGTKGLGWIRLSHVSRGWRALLLRMSDVWGRVVFARPFRALFPILLARARDAPLHVITNLAATQSEDGATYLSRARSLVVSGRSNGRAHAFLTSCTMPQLRYLKLYLDINDRPPPAESWAAFQDDEPRQPLPAEAYSGEDVHIDAVGLETAIIELMRESDNRIRIGVAPALADYRLPPTFAFNTSSLRALSVRIGDNAFPHSRHLEWIVALLRTSPLLQSLSLSLAWQISPFDWSVLDEGPYDQLPQLQRFTLEDSSGTCHSGIIGHLCTSTPAYFSASFGTFNRYQGATQDLLLAASVHFAKSYAAYLCRPGHRTLCIAIQGQQSLAIKSMPTVDDPSLVTFQSDVGSDIDPFWAPLQREEGTLLRIRARKIRDPSIAEFEWLSTLAGDLPRKEDVQHLHLYLYSGSVLGDDWTDVFREYLLRPMKAVHTVHIINGGPFFRCKASDWKALSQLICEPAVPVLPALHTLLIGFDVPKGFVLEEEGEGEKFDDWFDGLANLLSQRRANGVAVRTLRVISHPMRGFLKDRTDLQLARLAELVDNVVVDRRARMPRPNQAAT